MEWFLIALTGVLGFLSPAGLVADQVIEQGIRRSVAGVEELAVRVDNTPSWQIIQGKVQRARIASRGLEIFPQARIATAELEVEAVDFNWSQLEGRNLPALRRSLRRPLEGAFRLTLTQADINQALASADVLARLQSLLNRIVPPEAPPLTLKALQLTLLPENRLELALTLEQTPPGAAAPEILPIRVNTGLKLIEGRRLELVEPTATLGERRISSRILKTVAGIVNERLDLGRAQSQGVIARLLRWQISPEEIQIAGFLRLEPAAP